MEALDKKYKLRLDDIGVSIQNSEQLAEYLETEEYDEYKVLIEAYEDNLQNLYQEVAENNPLQLIALEKAMLDDALEGLYLPKVVGYSVLRGEVDEDFTYRRPQSHFKEILLYIAQSPNFSMIRQRAGQSIQTGFALSSDIWITNLIDRLTNKKVAKYLQSQKDNKYQVTANRRTALKKYEKQFASLNFYTAQFPENNTELLQEFYSLRHFLIYRANADFPNDSIMPYIDAFVKNANLVGTDEHIELLLIIGMKYDLPEATASVYAKLWKDMASAGSGLSEVFFEKLDKLHGEQLVDREADLRLSKLLKSNSTDAIKAYYDITDTLHSKGFIHEDSIEAVRSYYLQHQGQSLENECLRYTVLRYFVDFMENIDEDEYAEYFEINKTVTQYIQIFSNQKFNQSVKDASMVYIKKLLKRYTDKRGRDYQDIRKFVISTFSDLGFMTEKELKEFFKTRRKKK